MLQNQIEQPKFTYLRSVCFQVQNPQIQSASVKALYQGYVLFRYCSQLCLINNDNEIIFCVKECLLAYSFSSDQKYLGLLTKDMDTAFVTIIWKKEKQLKKNCFDTIYLWIIWKFLMFKEIAKFINYIEKKSTQMNLKYCQQRTIQFYNFIEKQIFINLIKIIFSQLLVGIEANYSNQPSVLMILFMMSTFLTSVIKEDKKYLAYIIKDLRQLKLIRKIVDTEILLLAEEMKCQVFVNFGDLAFSYSDSCIYKQDFRTASLKCIPVVYPEKSYAISGYFFQENNLIFIANEVISASLNENGQGEIKFDIYRLVL